MRRRLAVGLLWLIPLSGCGGGSKPDAADATGTGGETRAAANGSGESPYRIAVIPKGTTHDFWLSVHQGAVNAAEELGNVQILWDGPPTEKDKEKQINLMDGFILKQVDGICLAPIDRDALVPVVRRCNQKDIPVVIFDSGLSDPASFVSYVATDNYRGGQMAGERMVELLGGQGDVILLPYQEGSESTEQREKGFLDVIAGHPDITVLSADQRVGSDAEEALRISSSLLVQYGGAVDGIFTVCEPLNKGMLKALEDRQLASKVKFIGFDSGPRFVEALKAGKMQGIVLQDPVNMGYTAVKTLVAHLEGEDVPREISTGEALATPENMDEPRMNDLLRPPKFGHP